MKVEHFLNAIQHEQVHQAIKSAEEKNSGDIVIYITHRHVDYALAEAMTQFGKLRLDAAKNQNSFLIFLAPKSQTFAVVGGRALHKKVGQDWWHAMTDDLRVNFKAKRYTEGLIAAIEKAGLALKKHFPASDTDRTGQRDIVEE